MRLAALVACLCSPLVVLIAAPVARPSLLAPLGRWSSPRAPATPQAPPTADYQGEIGITLVRNHPTCLVDVSGAQVCLIITGPAGHTFHPLPSMFTDASTPTPVPTDTPWPGEAAMPTADTGYAPGGTGYNGP